MEMTTNNLCDSCTNIGCEFQSGIVRTECAFYMPPHIEPDNCGNYVEMRPTVESIQIEQYVARLKADLVAMLEDLKKEMNPIKDCEYQIYGKEKWNFVGKCQDVIQQKINALRGDIDEID